MKKLGYEIIGYACKSPSDVDLKTRLKLLQEMVNNLLGRSLVDKVYVLISSQASSPINERDLSTIDEIMGKLEHVTGSTPDKAMLHNRLKIHHWFSFWLTIDMLEYLQSVGHNVCLTSINFAGLSSRSYLIKALLK